MCADTVTVDVREDIRSGREPFSRIMSAVAGLEPTQDLLIVAPFEPTPLMGLLQKQGFGYSTNALASGDWEVRFTRHTAVPAPAGPASRQSAPPVVTPGTVVKVDARGLEPPQPMVTILESLAGLIPGAALEARTDRRPMHLYPQLELRGFSAETEQQSDGSFLTHIRRR